MGILRDVLMGMLGFGRPAPLSRWQVENQLASRAALVGERLDWRHSIVDLLKLVGMDSSLEGRKALARRLGYAGNLESSDTVAMNEWLHERVMESLAANGGKVNL